MATLTPKKIVLSNINGGKQYAEGEVVTPDAINAPIEASAYAQALATNQPDVSEAGKVGTPTVSIVTASDGTPRLKFANLKGERGEKGEAGESGTGGSSGGSGGSTTVSGGVKRISTHTMENYTPINITINERLGEIGAIVAVEYGTNGCHNFRPSISIYYGYFVDDPAYSEQEYITEFTGYTVIVGSGSRYNSADIEGIDLNYRLNITLNAEDYSDCIFDIEIDKQSKIVYVNISALATTKVIN